MPDSDSGGEVRIAVPQASSQRAGFWSRFRGKPKIYAADTDICDSSPNGTYNQNHQYGSNDCLHRKRGMSDAENRKYGPSMTFDLEKNTSSGSVDAEAGFGWIKGVLMRCVLCIFGATLFLRMSWMGGQAGIIESMAMILLSLLVVGVTAISMSAIATNGMIKNGGLYYLISRSLGPEWGGSIGFVLWLANTINASMNCVGLAETLVDIFKQNGIKLLDGAINDIRIYGLATCFLLQAIIFIGTEFENKTQVLLMITVVLSVLCHVVGSFFPSTHAREVRGVVGYKWSVFSENLWPDYRGKETFISVFGVYFPAMTGMMAGANMSGDLRDPSSAIPKGTIWGIIVTTVTYALSTLITSACTIRDADGQNVPVWNSTANTYNKPECYYNGGCKYGLANDFNVAVLQGAWSPLIIAGIVATTLSSASGCLIGGPRVLQALCEDKLFPFISFFAKGHGKTNDPFRAYFLTAAVAAAVICIGDLNAIAILITNMFLACFAITNFSCFDASAANSPGFRPGFRYYNRWVSLFGAVLCVGLMFALSWLTSLLTFFVLLTMFIYIKYNKSHINWGSSTEANRYRSALNKLHKITRTPDHVKNFRPQLLVLTGNPASRQALVDFAACITKGQNLMMCGHVIPHETDIYSTACIRKLESRFTDWLNEKQVRAFYCAVANPSMRAGVQQLLQSVGIGKMHPNILMLGYKANWLELCEQEDQVLTEYLGVIHDAFESNISLCIFRNGAHGLDHSALLSNNDTLFLKLPMLKKPDLSRANSSNTLRDDNYRVHLRPEAQLQAAVGRAERLDVAYLSAYMDVESRSVNFDDSAKPMDYERYRRKVAHGVVDLWWLYDDGGLQLLLAHLMTSSNSVLQGATLRVFTICSRTQNATAVREKTEAIMKKFRINFDLVQVLHDDDSELFEETESEYEQLVKQVNKNGEKQCIPEEVLTRYSDQTRGLMRQRELLLQYSKASSLVILSLPSGVAPVVTCPLYMLWLELLSGDMPPTLFVRGNQTPVLTFFA
ncbi:Solute carrier family 12 member 1 [Aphelenchoides fujianensis]|nr:Solute carrier family 12 member 1 [Aphelenchoides fujianensis]